MPRFGSSRPRLACSCAVALLLVLAGCGGGDDSPTITSDASATTTTATPGTGGTTATTAGTVLAVTVRGGSVEGASRQRATVNQPVTIRVTSDVADEVHVHGYNKTFEVPAGRTAEITFVANIPGVFEVEFERSHKALFSLEVR